jgi:hypothetical protein
MIPTEEVKWADGFMRKRFNALLRFDGNLGNDDGRSDLVIG